MIGNGNQNPVWLDPDGMYSVDQSFNGVPAKFSALTDIVLTNTSTASTNSSASCYDGNIAGTSGPSSGLRFHASIANTASSTANREISGFAVTSGIVTNFPKSVMTVSLWVRSSDINSLSTLVSYVQLDDIHNGDNISDSTQGMTSKRWQEFAIQDQTNIKVILRDYLHDSFDVEYDYVNENVRNGRITSNIGTMNDGTWHFLSVSWSSTDETVHVYVDTVLSYSSKINVDVLTLSSKGMFSVGASIRGDCLSNTIIESSRGVCGLIENTHFIGSLQGVRVWGVALTDSQRILEMQWPFAIEKPSALDELRLYWRFNNIGTPTIVKDLSNAFKNGIHEEISTTMSANDGIITRLLNNHNQQHRNESSNSISPADFEEAPCVEDEKWYFVAPSMYTGNIQSMYDGSIEFMLKIAQSSGVIRDYHGFIQMKSNDGNVLSYKMPNFQSASNEWSAYVVILREDFGWTRSNGTPVSTNEMIDVMKNVGPPPPLFFFVYIFF